MGLVLGVSPERFSRMPHGATCHWDDHRMPGHAPWDATCHWGLLGGWNVAVSGLAHNPSIHLYCCCSSKLTICWRSYATSNFKPNQPFCQSPDTAFHYSNYLGRGRSQYNSILTVGVLAVEAKRKELGVHHSYAPLDQLLAHTLCPIEHSSGA